MAEQKTDEQEALTDIEADEQESDDIETLIDKLELDPKVKEYVAALKVAKQSANDDSKKQRLAYKNLKTVHAEAVNELKDAKAKLQEIDDKEKPALQKATERVAELEAKLAHAEQAKNQFETNSFLLGSGVQQKHLKAVGLLLADVMSENPGLDRDAALDTIKEDHPFLWPPSIEAKEEKKVAKKVPVTTGTTPPKDEPAATKPKSLGEIARRSTSAKDRQAFVAQMKAAGIRL